MDIQTFQTSAGIDERDEPVGTSWVDTLIDTLGTAARHIALLAAWIATSGSLFMSEVLGWRPCVLCWYQRILMYPLAVLLAIGIIRRDRGLHVYVLPFSAAGMGVSLYHYLLIKTDWVPPPPCAVDVPCTVDYLNWFGFINIPFLALTAFTIITFMMLAFALLQPSVVDANDDTTPNEDTSPAALTAQFEPARLATIMIIVGVVLTFMVASTFV